MLPLFYRLVQVAYQATRFAVVNHCHSFDELEVDGLAKLALFVTPLSFNFINK